MSIRVAIQDPRSFVIATVDLNNQVLLRQVEIHDAVEGSVEPLLLAKLQPEQSEVTRERALSLRRPRQQPLAVLTMLCRERDALASIDHTPVLITRNPSSKGKDKRRHYSGNKRVYRRFKRFYMFFVLASRVRVTANPFMAGHLWRRA